MWKPLLSDDKVCAGDRLRFTQFYSRETSTEQLYEVVKVEQHYFELLLLPEESTSRAAEPDRKIVKYMDIGYHIRLEIWLGQVSHILPQA